MAEIDVDLDEALADPKVLALLEEYGVKFRVTALPPDVLDNANAKYFYLYIERKSPGHWAVADMFGDVLSRTGLWRYESMPSSRTDKFKEVTRFPLVDAFKLARREAAKMTLNRWTVETMTEEIRKWQAEKATAEAAEQEASNG
jgi:hypothetical protein